jgi:hypothetical protein
MLAPLVPSTYTTDILIGLVFRALG